MIYYMERFFLDVCKWLVKPCVVMILFVTSFVICIVMEFEITIFTCDSKIFVNGGNRFLLTLSYGVLVSSLFHLLVNVCPNIYKTHTLQPFIKSTMWDIREQLRQVLELPKNPFDLKDIPTQKGEISVSAQRDKCEERCECKKIFDNCNFLESYKFNKSIKLIDKFNEIRTEIRMSTDNLLRYRDLLSTEEFDFATILKKSLFLTTGLKIRTDISNEDEVNQKEMGECLFDLYEQSKGVTKI